MKKWIAVFLFAFAQGANAIDQDLINLAGQVLASKVDAKTNKRQAGKSELATRKINEKEVIPDLAGKTVCIIETGFVGEFSTNIIQGIASNELVRALGLAGIKTAESLERVREETSERKELRENEEVDKETLPPPATIKREDYQLSINVYGIQSRNDMKLFAINPFRHFDLLSLNYFELTKETSMVGIVVKIVDRKTEVAACVVGSIGSSSETTNMEIGAFGGYVQIEKNNEGKRELNAFQSALGNLTMALTTSGGIVTSAAKKK